MAGVNLNVIPVLHGGDAFPAAQRFFERLEGLGVPRYVFYTLFDALIATALMLAFMHGLPLTFNLKMTIGSIIVVVCVAIGLLWSGFRCLLLLMIPNCLSSSGQTYLMIITLSALYQGPGLNIQSNIQTAVESMSCNLDLQVNNSKLLLRYAVAPLMKVTKELMREEPQLQADTRNATSNFRRLRAALLSQYGYEFDSSDAGKSTQEKFMAKTQMQCDRVVDDSVKQCQKWLEEKWEHCMSKIPFPVVNDIVCVSMKFHFLCDIMRVMTPWCREQIPVEENFGELFDQLDVSMAQLSREFRGRLVMKEEKEQPVLDGDFLDKSFLDTMKAPFTKLRGFVEKVQMTLDLLKSFSSILVLIQATFYLVRYMNDILFDNIYITSFFENVDIQRRNENVLFLLPLNEGEEKKFIHPCRFRIHIDEYKQLFSGFLHFLALIGLTTILFVLDHAVFRTLDIISRNSFTQFNFTSGHLVNVNVTGDSMLARLLQTTVLAFNSSSHVHFTTDNRNCVIPPTSPSFDVSFTCGACLFGMALFSCLQIYANRARRVIASLFFPERERKRVMFLYNLLMEIRITKENKKSDGILPRPKASAVILQQVKERCVCH